MEKEIIRRYVKGERKLYYSLAQIQRNGLSNKSKIIHLRKLNWLEYLKGLNEEDGLYALIIGPHPQRMKYEKIYMRFDEAKEKCNGAKKENVESRVYAILESEEMKKDFLVEIE